MKIKLPASGTPSDISIPPSTEAEIVEAAPKLIKSPDGLNRLERMLEKTFPTETLVSYLQDLCQAEDTKIDKEGNHHQVPNWDARKNGLDRVIELLRYKRKDAPTSGEGMPVKLIFNVVNPTINAEKK